MGGWMDVGKEKSPAGHFNESPRDRLARRSFYRIPCWPRWISFGRSSGDTLRNRFETKLHAILFFFCSFIVSQANTTPTACNSRLWSSRVWHRVRSSLYVFPAGEQPEAEVTGNSLFPSWYTQKQLNTISLNIKNTRQGTAAAAAAAFGNLYFTATTSSYLPPRTKQERTMATIRGGRIKDKNSRTQPHSNLHIVLERIERRRMRRKASRLRGMHAGRQAGIELNIVVSRSIEETEPKKQHPGLGKEGDCLLDWQKNERDGIKTEI